MLCENCECLVINNLICHEQGCPDSWKNEIRECNWCGSVFQPDENDPDCLFCCIECFEDYRGK